MSILYISCSHSYMYILTMTNPACTDTTNIERHAFLSDDDDDDDDKRFPNIMECKVCCEQKSIHVCCRTCVNKICTQCAGKVSSCPYCRAKYASGVINSITQPDEYEYAWWDRNTPASTLELRRMVNFNIIRTNTSLNFRSNNNSR